MLQRNQILFCHSSNQYLLFIHHKCGFIFLYSLTEIGTLHINSLTIILIKCIVRLSPLISLMAVN